MIPVIKNNNKKVPKVALVFQRPLNSRLLYLMTRAKTASMIIKYTKVTLNCIHSITSSHSSFIFLSLSQLFLFCFLLPVWCMGGGLGGGMHEREGGEERRRRKVSLLGCCSDWGSILSRSLFSLSPYLFPPFNFTPLLLTQLISP